MWDPSLLPWIPLPVSSVRGYGSAAAFHAGASSNFARFKWDRRQNAITVRLGISIAELFPACAIFEFGNGHTAEVRHAAEILVGIAGRQGALAACFVYADIPTLVCKGTLELLGGKLDFSRNRYRLGKMGTAVPLRVDTAGRFVSGAPPIWREGWPAIRSLGHSIGYVAFRGKWIIAPKNSQWRSFVFWTSTMDRMNSRPLDIRQCARLWR